MAPTPISSPSRESKTISREKTRELVQEEKQVIVHCRYTCTNIYGMYIRIWPTTYLVARDAQHTSEMVHAENIPLAPEWMPVGHGETAHFTLIFTGLPGDCRKFDLREIVTQDGGFYVPGIQRNEMDVYNIEIND